MKVLLVWPPFNDAKFLPLGLGYVAGAVSAAGHEARILDLNAAVYAALRAHWRHDPRSLSRISGNWHWDEGLGAALSRLAFPGEDATADAGTRALAEVIRAAMEPALADALHGIDLVGVSTTETGLLGAVYVSKLSKLVRAAAERPPTIVWGGSQCSARIGPVLLRALDVMDVVIYGDGEAPMQALLEALGGDRGPAAFAGVPGLIWREGDEVRVNDAALTAPLDAIPRPDFSSLDPAGYPLLALPVLASRGCAWNRCTFCSEPMIWPEVRQRTPRDVVAEVREGVERFHPAWVSFNDTAANGRPDGISAVVDEMIAQGFHYQWSALILALSVDRDLFVRMRRTGCADLFVGAESLDDDVLRLMKKGVTFVHTLRVLKLAAEQDIKMTSNLITSFPGETAAHVRRTIARLERYGYLFRGAVPSLSPFEAQQGAAVYEEPGRYRVRILGPSTTARAFPERLRGEPIFWNYLWERLDEPAGEAADHALALRELAQALERLRRTDLPRMSYRDDPAAGRVRIEAARGAGTETTLLEGEDREVFLACDEIGPLRRVAEVTGRPPDEVRAIAERLEQRALVALSSGLVMNTVPRSAAAEAARPEEARRAGGKVHLGLA